VNFSGGVLFWKVSLKEKSKETTQINAARS